MARWAIELSYDGSMFDGWQSLPSGRGVQDSLGKALVSLGESSSSYGAGRTDRGVHARAMTAHIDLKKDWADRRIVLALNAHLPDAVRVMRAARTSEDFHARHSAIAREYRYFIYNASSCYPHISKNVLHLPGSSFDWEKARRAARSIEGTHDFRAFCRTADAPDDTHRSVDRSTLTKRGPLIVYRVVAPSFLTNMIRITVGNLIAIASGRMSAHDLGELLKGAERKESAQTVSPQGLFFWRAIYPFDIFAS